MSLGYYLPEINFSVRFYNGQWCLFSRHPTDVLATDPIIQNAIQQWKSINRGKFHSSTASK